MRTTGCLKRVIIYLLCCLVLQVYYYYPAESASTSTSVLELPVIDLSPWFDVKTEFNADTNKTKTTEYATKQVDMLRQAASLYGSAYLYTGRKNTEILHKEVLRRASQEVFAVEDFVKKRYQIQSSGFTRGYVLLGGESGSSHRREVKEGFSYGKEWPIKVDRSFDNELQGFNVWPKPEENFSFSTKFILNNLFEELALISKTLVRLISLSLNLESETALDDDISEGDTISLLRLFHYFGKAENEELFRFCKYIDQFQQIKSDDKTSTLYDRCTGSSPHSDWGMITLVGIGADDSGLEFSFNDTWYKVSPPSIWSYKKEELIVVNFGDYLSVATNYAFRSPLHRVVIGDSDRYSYVYFFYPNFDARLKATTSEGSENLSLLKKQDLEDLGSSKPESDDADDDAVKQKEIQIESFGEFILDKWRQVFRNTHMAVDETTLRDEL